MNHSNLSAASKAFGEIATTQNNAAAAALAIHLAVAASEAYAAEIEERQRQAANLRTAVADSIATGQPVTVTVTDADAATSFLYAKFVDVDWDTYPDRITIFGDDQRIPVSPDGDGYEAHFVLNLVCPKETRFTAIFRKPSGEIVTDSLSYHEPMDEALDAAHEDAHRYGWTFVSLQTVTA